MNIFKKILAKMGFCGPGGVKPPSSKIYNERIYGCANEQYLNVLEGLKDVGLEDMTNEEAITYLKSQGYNPEKDTEELLDFVRDILPSKWKCRRCGEIVDMARKRCGCKESPSPWEPINKDAEEYGVHIHPDNDLTDDQMKAVGDMVRHVRNAPTGRIADQGENDEN